MSLIILNKDIEVKSGGEYISRMLNTNDDDKVCDFMDKNEKQTDLIEKIIATDVAYFALRRCAGNGYCGSNCDTILRIRRDYIYQYEKKYGKWVDYNKNVDY